MSMYYPPYKPDEIYHWGIKKGEEAKKHKYFTRIITGVKDGKNVYRYFYDKKEWDAYVSNQRQQRPTDTIEKQNVGTITVTHDDGTTDVIEDKSKSSSPLSWLSRLIFGAVGSKIIEKGREIVSNLLNKDDNITVEHETYIPNNDAQQPSNIKPKEPEKPKQTVSDDVVKARKKAADDAGGIENPEGERQYKYIAKIPMGDGTFRYFYDQESLRAYYEATNDELFHEFGVKEGSCTTVDDALAINERYWDGTIPEGERADYENNCYSCTTAFELRKRGYDVDAINDPDGETWQTVLSMYESPTKKSYHGGDEEATINNLIEDLTAEGEGARGNLCVYWKGGGGHSMAWEIKDGQVEIWDTQTGRMEPYKGYAINILFKDYVDTTRENDAYNVTPDGYLDPFKLNPNSKPYYEWTGANPIQWIRTDTAELNTDNIKKYVRKDY